MKKLRLLPFFLGLGLLLINAYGLTQKIEPATYNIDDLRFIKKENLSYLQTINSVDKLENEKKFEYLIRLNKLIFNRMTHIKWNELDDIDKYNQRVPIWENYLLYSISLITNITEFQKYHFADYKRSLERGIGVCGDLSMIMSSILTNNDIPNKILSMPGHVVIYLEDMNRKYIFDPDFGIYFELTSGFNESTTIENIKKSYLLAGYPEKDVEYLISQYTEENHNYWDGPSHFIKKKFYFEYISYYLKWLIPFFLLAISYKNEKRN